MPINPAARTLPLTGSPRSVRLPTRPARNLGAATPTARQQTFQAMLAGSMPALRPAMPAGVARAPSPQASPQVPNGYSPLVADAARRYGVDPALVAAVIESESGFNPRATSPAGAKGLMQLMDGTARGLGVTDSYDPVQNVHGGTKYLRQMLDKYNGDARLALAAYNAGGGAVDRFGGIPPYPETQRYVPRVLAAAEKYRGLGTHGF
jgi:soluble lytic murein transglycosylase-like protein